MVFDSGAFVDTTITIVVHCYVFWWCRLPTALRIPRATDIDIIDVEDCYWLAYGMVLILPLQWWRVLILEGGWLTATIGRTSVPLPCIEGRTDDIDIDQYCDEVIPFWRIPIPW